MRPQASAWTEYLDAIPATCAAALRSMSWNYSFNSLQCFVRGIFTQSVKAWQIASISVLVSILAMRSVSSRDDCQDSRLTIRSIVLTPNTSSAIWFSMMPVAVRGQVDRDLWSPWQHSCHSTLKCWGCWSPAKKISVFLQVHQRKSFTTSLKQGAFEIWRSQFLSWCSIF